MTLAENLVKVLDSEDTDDVLPHRCCFEMFVFRGGWHSEMGTEIMQRDTVLSSEVITE